MKGRKTIVAVILLFALLLSSCGQGSLLTAERRPETEEETTAAKTAAAAETVVLTQAQPQPLSAFRDAPAGSAASAPKAAPAGPVTPERVKTDMFRAKFEGSAVAGSGEAVDGVYRFTATQTDGEAWHVKLECNYPTIAGRDYRVTYRFRSDVAGKVKFGDFQEFEIKEGENSVTGMMIATSGTSYLDLQLGMLKPFTIDFTEIEVEEFADEVEYENALPVPVNFEKESLVWEKHDQGYAPAFTRSSDEVSIEYLSTAWDAGVWKSRLYIRTGLIPESGVHYHITADVSCDQDMPFEVLFNNGEEEKGYGALYGQNLTGGETTNCEAVITGSSEGDELVLQFSLGQVPEGAVVKVGNLRVETIRDHYADLLGANFALNTSAATGKTLYGAIPTSFKNVPLTNFSYSGTDTVFEGHDDGYVVSLEESGSSATLKITQAPESDRGVWKVRLFAATGVTLEAGSTYRIKYDLASAGNQAKYEVLFSGDSDEAYGADKGRSLTAGGTDHVEYIVTPDESHGPLTLRFQLGETDTTAGNTVTLSGLSVEKLSTEYKPVGSVTLDAGISGNVWEEHGDGFEQTVSASDGKAVLSVAKARGGEEGGVWSSRLYVATGVIPEAGERYRVGATLAAAADTGEFEILYQNSGSEKLYGGQWGLTGAGEYSSDFTAPASGCGELVLVFQLGNSAAENTITLSDIRVCKISSDSTAQIDLPGFAYPVAGVETVVNNSFDLETNEGAKAELTGNGSSATVTVTTPGDDWHVKLYAKPGMELEAGQLYTISMDVTGADGSTVSFKNTAVEGEEGFGTETISSGKVSHSITPAVSGMLEIILKIGNVPADTAVKVSNVQIEKTTTSDSPITLEGFAYPVPAGETTANNSFDLYVNPAAEASLTGDGSSATATVSTPGEGWHVKMYAKPGLDLEAGQSYTVTMDVTGADGCKASFKNTAVEGEEGFGSETISGGKVSHSVTPDTAGTLEIVLEIGAVPAGTAVTVSNIRIWKNTTDYIPLTLSGLVYPSVTHNEASNGSFDVDAGATMSSSAAGSATATVNTQGADWSIKFYVKPQKALESGKLYRVSVNVAGANGCQLCFKDLNASGDSAETAYGDVWLSSDNQTVSKDIKGTGGVMEIFVKIGALAAGSKVTLSGVRIEEYKNLDLSGTTYELQFNAHEGGTPGSGSQNGNAFTIDSQPDPLGDDSSWLTKFYVKPAVTMQSGKRYLVSFSLLSPHDGFDVGFMTRDPYNEEAYGKDWYRTNQLITKEIEGDGNILEILVKAAYAPAGSTTTFSGLVITDLSSVKDVTPAITAPTEASETVNAGSFTLTGTAALGGNGSDSATAAISSGGSSAEDIVLTADTGVELEANKNYQIKLSVDGADGCPVTFMNTTAGTPDGFGTETISGGTVSHMVKPDGNGRLHIRVLLGSLPADTVVTLGNIQVSEYKTGDLDITPAALAYPYTETDSMDPRSFELYVNEAAAAKLGGNGSSNATVTVTTPKDDWHIQLYAKTEVKLEAGKNYRISMNVTGADGCTAFYKNTTADKEDGFGTEAITSGTVTHTVTPTEEGNLHILLKLGTVPANTVVTVSDIQIAEYTASGENAMPSDFAYPQMIANGIDRKSFDLEANSGAAATLGGDGSSATATVTTPGDDWHVKLYAKPGVKLEEGKSYQVSLSVTGANGCQICYKNADHSGEGDAEVIFGTETASDGTVTHSFTAGESGTLEILLKIGNVPAGTAVKVSDVAIREAVETAGDNLMPALTTAQRGNVTFWAHEDYAADLSLDSGTANLAISKTPAEGKEPWKIKLFVDTGVGLKAGKLYRISADVKSTAELDYELCCTDGVSDAPEHQLAPTKGGLHAASSVRTVSCDAAPGTDGTLTLQFNLGSASPATVSISNVKVEEVTEGESETVLPSFRYDSVGSFASAADDGYVVSLDKAASSAAFHIHHAPAERNPWNVKLNVHTGFTPTKDKGYRVSFDIDADKAQNSFELFFDGTAEGAYGQFFGPALPSGKTTVSQIIYPGDSKGELVLQIRLGKTDDTDGNHYTVSNVKIEEVTFRYTQTPEMKEVTTLQTQNGYNEHLEKTRDRATVRIEKVPATGREAWKSKLFVETGVKLKEGEKYRVSMDVKSIIPAPFEVCFNNGSVEKGLGAMFGLLSTPSGQHVEYVTYARQDTQLVIQLSLGNCSAPNSIILSNVSVQKAGKIDLISDTIYTF